jgi:amidase
MRDILQLSGKKQAELVRSRKISGRELVDAHLKQIAAVNPAINAVTELLGPQDGVPFSVKDSIDVAGARSTAGTLGRRSAAPATEDATLVARIRATGGVPICKTNLPDLLFAFESDNLIFGRTNNPYGLDRTSGGSSGGEAGLIACCGSPFGLGSDAAGSVRVPAAFCGIASIKPTSGRLPRTGHVPPAGGWLEAVWQIGPMARRVEDLVMLMPLLARSDGRDQTVVDMPVLDPARVNLRELRVAFYTDNGLAAADKEVTAVVRAAAATLASEEARPACLTAAYDLEMGLIGADGGDGLRRYLCDIGSREVHPLLTGWLDKLEPYRTNLAGFAARWDEWQRYQAEMLAFMTNYDAILCPAYVSAAVPHGTSIEDERFLGFSHTMAYNVAGWPAAVVRCGTSAEGLPIAVQIAARPWREDIVLAIALHLEEAFGGWMPPPLVSALA